ncbi:hypothetical protein [Paenibacillus thermotolerans]|uniref:hypothetical protein n=1 Tax=Paenibacillus thermotolerans TaxID=3027807 RepID=UPI00236816FB|nr:MULTISPECIES: hypothetical protein [unclassified Paenibacillus]
MASPYLRSIPYGNGSLEDVAIQYLPSTKKLIVTFYYNGFQFALISTMIDDEFQPIKIINNLKKDNDDVRCQLILSLLNDQYKQIYKTIAEASPSFQTIVDKEYNYWL